MSSSSSQTRCASPCSSRRSPRSRSCSSTSARSSSSCCAAGAATGASARAALATSDLTEAERALMPLASSAQMADTLSTVVAQHGQPGADDRRAKALADFDLRSLRKLERSRMLVRFGPALGLMGTLIPLSPALEGLAKGDVALLSENLRAAFSVTVLGLLIGAVAFSISLVRDRLYAQDLSDLEYVVAALEPQERR
jgi:biopolymer transport protein ExbB/TolQ